MTRSDPVSATLGVECVFRTIDSKIRGLFFMCVTLKWQFHSEAVSSDTRMKPLGASSGMARSMVTVSALSLKRFMASP